MGKKNVFGLCVGLSCSMIFSGNDILWDFGVIINQSDYNIHSKVSPNQYLANQKGSQIKINAVISDPFIPPRKNTMLHDVTNPTRNILSKNISQIISEAKKYYLKNKYGHVIELLQQIDLTGLADQQRFDLEYLLAEAFYQTGEYNKAMEQVFTSLEQNESDRLCILLAKIYESIGEKNKAKEYYLKLIDRYPDSDYIISAHIKFRMLDRQ